MSRSKKDFATAKPQSNPKNIRLKGDHYFKVSIESDVVESCVTCWLLNVATKETATLKFHLHNCDGIASATVTIPITDSYKYAWVSNHLDLISPMVCRTILSIK